MSGSPPVLRRLCWLTAALFLPSGAALLGLALTRGDLLRLPVSTPLELDVAAAAVGSAWVLVGAACALLASALSPRRRPAMSYEL